MKILLAALFSVAFIWAVPARATPVNNVDSSTKVQTVQAKPTEHRPQVTLAVAEEKAPTEPEAEPTPETVTVETPEPISHPTGCENYRQLISQYDWNADTFLRIAEAESGCNPTAVGDEFTINGIYAPSCGLFQVRTLSSRPPCEELKDPATNIAWAYSIYQGQGFGAWSVCSFKISCW